MGREFRLEMPALLPDQVEKALSNAVELGRTARVEPVHAFEPERKTEKHQFQHRDVAGRVLLEVAQVLEKPLAAGNLAKKGRHHAVARPDIAAAPGRILDHIVDRGGERVFPGANRIGGKTGFPGPLLESLDFAHYAQPQSLQITLCRTTPQPNGKHQQGSCCSGERVDAAIGWWRRWRSRRGGTASGRVRQDNCASEIVIRVRRPIDSRHGSAPYCPEVHPDAREIAGEKYRYSARLPEQLPILPAPLQLKIGQIGMKRALARGHGQRT